MKAAKIISLIAFVLNSYLSVYTLLHFLKIRPMFKELRMPIPFPWPIFVALIFTIGSIIHWFYLRNKEKKGETAKFALWVSIALLLIPLLIIVPISAFTYTQPLYEYLRTIK